MCDGSAVWDFRLADQRAQSRLATTPASSSANVPTMALVLTAGAGCGDGSATCAAMDTCIPGAGLIDISQPSWLLQQRVRVLLQA